MQGTQCLQPVFWNLFLRPQTRVVIIRILHLYSNLFSPHRSGTMWVTCGATHLGAQQCRICWHKSGLMSSFVAWQTEHVSTCWSWNQPQKVIQSSNAMAGHQLSINTVYIHMRVFVWSSDSNAWSDLHGVIRFCYQFRMAATTPLLIITPALDFRLRHSRQDCSPLFRLFPQALNLLVEDIGFFAPWMNGERPPRVIQELIFGEKTKHSEIWKPQSLFQRCYASSCEAMQLSQVCYNWRWKQKGNIIQFRPQSIRNQIRCSILV